MSVNETQVPTSARTVTIRRPSTFGVGIVHDAPALDADQPVVLAPIGAASRRNTCCAVVVEASSDHVTRDTTPVQRDQRIDPAAGHRDVRADDETGRDVDHGGRNHYTSEE